MIRRTFLFAIAFFALAPAAFAANFVTYEPGKIQALLASGKTVLVDYKASWCSTCARQERVINELRSKNPAYDKSLTFVAVDWDEFGTHEVTTSRNVPRRSTLLLLKGDKELGRIVAGTATSDIKALLDKGL